MKILFLNQFFYPDLAPTAVLATDVAIDLAAKGHEVIAIACDTSYAARRNRLPHEENYQGVRILRVPVFGPIRDRWMKVANYAAFYSGALVSVCAQSPPDVIVSLSTPPFLATIGLLARYLRRTRLIFWVMDVYPEVAVRVGAIRENGHVHRALKVAGRCVLQNTDVIIALDSEMYKSLLAAGAPAERMHVVDNWCDGEAIKPRPIAGNSLRQRCDLGEDFTVSYSGNFGNAHEFETVVEAAKSLRNDPIRWLLIGGGPQRDRIKHYADSVGLHRIVFLPHREKEELPESLTAAHVSLITLRADMAGLVVPSKLYGLLAAGIPILYVGPPKGRVAELIRDEKIGIRVANHDVAGLVQAVHLLREAPEMRSEMGRQARIVFDRRFRRDLALGRLRELILRESPAPLLR